MNYLDEIEARERRATRRQLRATFEKSTGRPVPSGCNLRRFVPRWIRDQQAINAGARPTPLWKKAVGVA